MMSRGGKLWPPNWTHFASSGWFMSLGRGVIDFSWTVFTQWFHFLSILTCFLFCRVISVCVQKFLLNKYWCRHLYQFFRDISPIVCNGREKFEADAILTLCAPQCDLDNGDHEDNDNHEDNGDHEENDDLPNMCWTKNTSRDGSSMLWVRQVVWLGWDPLDCYNHESTCSANKFSESIWRLAFRLT